MWHATSQLIIQCCTIKTKPIKYATHSISPLTVKSAHPGDNISNSAASLFGPPPSVSGQHCLSPPIIFLWFAFTFSDFPIQNHCFFIVSILYRTQLKFLKYIFACGKRTVNNSYTDCVYDFLFWFIKVEYIYIVIIFFQMASTTEWRILQGWIHLRINFT